MKIGFYETDNKNKLIAYNSLTILNNATPTKYEREQITLKESLNYVQGKLIIVHPYYWGKNIARNLMDETLKIANELSMNFVADVKQENHRAIKFLEKLNIQRLFEWKNPKGTKMWRMRKCQ